MQTSELSTIFKDLYHQAEKGSTVVTIHLFGIKYAGQLEGHNLKEICTLADVPTSFATEIRKGMRLAEHVTLK